MSTSKLYTATFREGDGERAKAEAEMLSALGVAVAGPEFTKFDHESAFGTGYWLVVWNPYERVA